MSLSNVDLNLMVALDALLTERNVTRAAARVGISQPGMSSALRRLRKLLDDPLLVREGNLLVPTVRAQAIADPVRTALAAIDEAIQDRISFDPGSDARTFDISCSDYSSVLLVAPLIRRLNLEAPLVTVRLQPRSADPTSALRSGAVDLVIEPVEIMGDAKLESQALFEDRWLCCIWQGNDAVGETMDLPTYQRLPHVAYSMGAGAPTSLVDDHMERLEVTRNVELVVESFLLAPLLLHETDLVTMVLERALPMFERLADLRVLEPPVKIPPIVQAMWWSPRRTGDPALAWLRAALAQVARDLVALH